jgi:hypothetical protein
MKSTEEGEGTIREQCGQYGLVVCASSSTVRISSMGVEMLHIISVKSQYLRINIRGVPIPPLSPHPLVHSSVADVFGRYMYSKSFVIKHMVCIPLVHSSVSTSTCS